ncbi:hypothetical protein CR513_34265, partial [Mucuna pruriens]
MRKYTVQAWGLALACILLLFVLTPSIPQPQRYHNFADKRKFFGIPNALNVISNFPFAVIGLIGLVLCHPHVIVVVNYVMKICGISLQGELWGWTCFYVGVTSVAFGSSYYHLDPDDAGLLWDRLPMTVAFASLLAILIIERIDAKKGTISIVLLITAGIISCVDSRQAYFFIPSICMISLVTSVYIFWPKVHHALPYLSWLFCCLQCTRIQHIGSGLQDFIFWLCCKRLPINGHTLKHLSAAMVPAILTVMLAKRSVYLGKLLHVRNTQIHPIIVLKESMDPIDDEWNLGSFSHCSLICMKETFAAAKCIRIVIKTNDI